MVLAKSVDGEKDLVQVEEWIEKKEGEEDFTQVIKPRKGEPADKELYAEVIQAAKAKFDVYPSAYANAWVVREYKKRGGKYKAESKKKGFHRVLNLIETMPDFNFCLVMKDDTNINVIPQHSRSRVRIFNKVDRDTVRLLINSSVCAICTSGNEEGHFAGIEIGACGIPMVARPMGCYLDRKDDKSWGLISNDEDFPNTIRYVVNNLGLFNPREYYSKEYTLERCREKWVNLINEFVK